MSEVWDPLGFGSSFMYALPVIGRIPASQVVETLEETHKIISREAEKLGLSVEELLEKASRQLRKQEEH